MLRCSGTRGQRHVLKVWLHVKTDLGLVAEVRSEQLSDTNMIRGSVRKGFAAVTGLCAVPAWAVKDCDLALGCHDRNIHPK